MGGVMLAYPLKLAFAELEEAAIVCGEIVGSGATSFNGPGVGAIPGDQLEIAG